MKIVVAYDGSDSGDDALYDSQRAGLPRETEAIIVSVAEACFLVHLTRYEIIEKVLDELSKEGPDLLQISLALSLGISIKVQDGSAFS